MYCTLTEYVYYISRLLGTPLPRTVYFLVEAKSRVREVYTQTCLHFSKQGMLDTELFGLAILIGNLWESICFVHMNWNQANYT